MHALVTGAAGFVGGHLLDHLFTEGDKVTALVAPGTRPRHTVESSEVDITDYRKTLDCITSITPDVIFHLAGMAFAPSAESDFMGALTVNVGGTFNIVRAAHLLDREIPVVLVSSGEVYGRVSAQEVPVKETQPLRPANSYSLTKLMSEQVVSRFEGSSKLKLLTMRPFNHTGPGQNESFVCSNFAKQLAEMKLGKIPSIIRVGNLLPERDFSDVRDIVRAYRLAAVQGHGVYNLGSGTAVPVSKILNELISISGLDVKIESDPERVRPSEVPRLFADISKAERELGWRPKIPLRQTLSELYDFWLRELSK